MVSVRKNEELLEISQQQQANDLKNANLNISYSIGIDNSGQNNPEILSDHNEFEFHDNPQDVSVSSAEIIDQDSSYLDQNAPNSQDNRLDSSVEIIEHDPEALEYEEFEFHSDEERAEILEPALKNEPQECKKPAYESIEEMPMNVSIDNIKILQNKFEIAPNRITELINLESPVNQSEIAIQTDPMENEFTDISNIPSFLMQSIREILKDELLRASRLPCHSISSFPESSISFCSVNDSLQQSNSHKRYKSIIISLPLTKPIVQLQQEKKKTTPVIQADCSGAKYKRPTGKEIQKKVLQLNNLGFTSQLKSISALVRTNYDVMLSVEVLMNN